MSKNVIALFFLLLLFSCGKKSEPESISSFFDDQVAVFTADSTTILVEDTDHKYKDSRNTEGEYPADWFNSIHVLGTGAINIHGYYPFEYDDSNSGTETERFNSLALYNDKECTDLYVEYIFTTGMVPAAMNIIPLYNAADYDYYCFVTTSQNEISYQVALNDDVRKYVKKEKYIEYKDWDKFFTDIFYINPTDENPFRSEPNKDAKIVKVEIDDDSEDEFIDSYRTVKIEGEWMYLTFTKMPKQSGVWIKWRDGERIILDTSISV